MIVDNRSRKRGFEFYRACYKLWQSANRDVKARLRESVSGCTATCGVDDIEDAIELYITTYQTRCVWCMIMYDQSIPERYHG